MCQEQVNHYSFKGSGRTRLAWKRAEDQHHYWLLQKCCFPLVDFFQMSPGLLDPGTEVLRSARGGLELINHRVPAHQELSGAPVLPHTSFCCSSFLIIWSINELVQNLLKQEIIRHIDDKSMQDLIHQALVYFHMNESQHIFSIYKYTHDFIQHRKELKSLR